MPLLTYHRTSFAQNHGDRVKMTPWYLRNPELLQSIEDEIDCSFPGLRLVIHDGKVIVRGRLDVFYEGAIYDSYNICIHLSDDHPISLPLVFEEGGRIPRIPARHVNDDGTACLFVFFERKKFWTDANSIKELIGGPINAYFYAQTYYEREGCYPYGERGHGLIGILEAIAEHMGFDSIRGITKTIEILEHDEIKGHWLCPCGNGSVIRSCHAKELSLLKGWISSEDAKAIRILLNQAIRKMSEKAHQEDHLISQMMQRMTKVN